MAASNLVNFNKNISINWKLKEKEKLNNQRIQFSGNSIERKSRNFYMMPNEDRVSGSSLFVGPIVNTTLPLQSQKKNMDLRKGTD